MKRIALLSIAVSLFLFSCTRSADLPQQPDGPENSFEKRTIVQNLDSTVLTLTIQPSVVCYGADAGNAPCNLIVNLHCSLSKPIAAGLRIEIEKITMAEVKDSTSLNAETYEPNIVLNLAPYRTSISVTTGNIINDSPETIRDKYRLKSVSAYKVSN